MVLQKGSDWVGGGSRREAALRVEAFAGQAFQVAVRATGSHHQAEDAVQQAMLAVLRELPAGMSADEERLWFLRAAANAAGNQLRGEQRRRKREVRAMQERTAAPPEAAVPDSETVAALRRAMMELEARYRLPVALCCEQGLTKRQAAAVLEMPESTVSKYVQVGLERLKEMLKRAGCTAAPAAVLGTLAHTAPPVPATLAAAVEKIVSGQVPVVGSGSGSAGAAVGVGQGRDGDEGDSGSTGGGNGGGGRGRAFGLRLSGFGAAGHGGRADCCCRRETCSGERVQGAPGARGGLRVRREAQGGEDG
jgi:RNA polymerase sigma factor (sigma-70 family)